MDFAFISRGSQTLSPSGAPQFLGERFKLLNPILLDTIAFTPTDADPQHWEVRFFHGSPFAQQLRIDFVDGVDWQQQDIKAFRDTHWREYEERITCFFSAMQKAAAGEGNTAALLSTASLLLRGSNTLKHEDCLRLSNGLRHIDPRGMVIIDDFRSEQNRKQNDRLALLLMLGHAYRLAMQQISEALAEILKNQETDKLDSLYRDAATFNARFYFTQPVNLDKYPSASAWEDIRDSLQLERQNQELSRQITQVHQILSHCQRKEEQRLDKEQAEREKAQLHRQEKRDRKITLFGTVISLFGLIEIADILAGWLA